MEKTYREIKFMAGESIESAIKDLAPYKEKGEFVCGNFNGHKLYSDVDDLDSAYKKITGKTKSEFDEIQDFINNDGVIELIVLGNEAIGFLAYRTISLNGYKLTVKGNTDRIQSRSWQIKLYDRAGLYEGMNTFNL